MRGGGVVSELSECAPPPQNPGRAPDHRYRLTRLFKLFYEKANKSKHTTSGKIEKLILTTSIETISDPPHLVRLSH